MIPRIGWVNSWYAYAEGIMEHNESLSGGAKNPAARLFDGVFFDTYGEGWC